MTATARWRASVSKRGAKTGMLAALPMYDRPELRAQTDLYWRLIRDELRERGVFAPDGLWRGEDLWSLWRSPELVFAQTCGMPYRAQLHGEVSLVATPDYDLPGCEPGEYNSVVITREGVSDREALGGTWVINEALSQSGWGALAVWLGQQGIALKRPALSGSHAGSAQAVASGEADLAAIDALTWALLQRFGETRGLREIARTDPTPTLPYITAKGAAAEPVFDAVSAAVAELPGDVAEALSLRGVVRISHERYMALPIPPSPETLPAAP